MLFEARDSLIERFSKQLAVAETRRDMLRVAARSALGGLLTTWLPNRAMSQVKSPDPTSSYAACVAWNNQHPSGPKFDCSLIGPVCPTGWAYCGGSDKICKDLKLDPSNCGSCNSVCIAGASCCGGKCCGGTGTNKGCCASTGYGVGNPATYTCVTLLANGKPAGETDNVWNCGTCGTVCQDPEGTGRCCSGTCVDSGTDPKNCGQCGKACVLGANQSANNCVNGSCVPICSNGLPPVNGLCCPAGQTVCNGSCVTLGSDTQNCGACGEACVGGQVCVNGICTGGGGQGAGNSMLFNACQPIQGLTVSMQAGTEAIVSTNGFSLQLNAWPTALQPASPAGGQCPAPNGICWMQSCINIQGNQVIAFVQSWDNSGMNEGGNPVVATLPVSNTLPAGWRLLEIALANDNSGNVNGITLSVTNDQGKIVGSKPLTMPTHSGTNSTALAPVPRFLGRRCWAPDVQPHGLYIGNRNTALLSFGRTALHSDTK